MTGGIEGTAKYDKNTADLLKQFGACLVAYEQGADDVYTLHPCIETLTASRIGFSSIIAAPTFDLYGAEYTNGKIRPRNGDPIAFDSTAQIYVITNSASVYTVEQISVEALSEYSEGYNILVINAYTNSSGKIGLALLSVTPAGPSTP